MILMMGFKDCKETRRACNFPSRYHLNEQNPHGEEMMRIGLCPDMQTRMQKMTPASCN